MGAAFPESAKDWQPNTIDELFKIDVLKEPLPAARRVLQNLQTCTEGVDSLILWLDCDREGEAIAFDVLEHCQEKNENLEVYRAHFSALTMQDVTQAMENLTPPNKNLSDAVKVRQELDLRVGASFTRFQTLHLRGILGPLNNMVLSYGPCQFPTLGFVVQRQ